MSKTKPKTVRGEIKLFRRHLPTCKLRSMGRRATNCQCPIWCDGRDNGKRVLHTMQTSNWERAERKLARITDPDAPASAIAVGAAVADYLADCKARNLAPSTVRSYDKTLGHFTDWCAHESYPTLSSLTVEAFTRFRASRRGRNENEPAKPSTLRKELECWRAFCAFSVERGWMAQNLAQKLKPPKESAQPTLPFEPSEINRILEATERIGNREHANIFEARRSTRAFIELLLYSGLRISDATKIEKARLNPKTRHLVLRQMKTGVVLSVKLPESLVSDLCSSANPGPYFFWSGIGKLSTKVGNLRATIQSVMKLAGVVSGHPHRFRDTFARDLLEQDVPIRTVQLLLGHSSVRTTEKHYAHFVQSTQRLLDAATDKLSYGSPRDRSLRELPKLTLEKGVGNSKRIVRATA